MRFTYTQKNPRRISQLRSCIATAGPGSGIVPATPTRLMVMSGCTMNWPNSSVMPGHRPPPTRSGRGAINLRSTAGTLLLPGQPPSTQWVFRDEQRGAGGGAPVRPHPRGRRRGSTRRGRRRKGIGAAGGWSSLRDASYRQPNPCRYRVKGEADAEFLHGGEGVRLRSVRRCEACRARPGSARRGRCGGSGRERWRGDCMAVDGVSDRPGRTGRHGGSPRTGRAAPERPDQ